MPPACWLHWPFGIRQPTHKLPRSSDARKRSNSAELSFASAQQRQKFRHLRQLALGLLRRSGDDASAAGAASAAEQPSELADVNSLESLTALQLLSVAADLPTCLQQVMLGADRRTVRKTCLFIRAGFLQESNMHENFFAQAEQLLQRLETRRVDAELQPLDSAAALAFLLTCQWQHLIQDQQQKQKIHNSSNDTTAAANSGATEAAVVEALSRSVAVLARLLAANKIDETASSPSAAEVASVLADAAADITASGTVWRQLLVIAAAACLQTSEQPLEEELAPADSHEQSVWRSADVGDKVRQKQTLISDMHTRIDSMHCRLLHRDSIVGELLTIAPNMQNRS